MSDILSEMLLLIKILLINTYPKRILHIHPVCRVEAFFTFTAHHKKRTTFRSHHSKPRGSMILKTLLSLTIFTLNLTFLFADHAQISSFTELEEELEKSDEKTLIVFDVDEVLITTEDHFIHPYADKAFFPLIHQIIAKAASEKEKIEIEEKLSLSMLLPKRTLIEESAPNLIKNLQQKGAKVIALTSCPTGAFGVIPKVERWRIEHLHSLNISFASSFPKIEPCFINDLATSGNPSPLFEQGVLFSKGYKKGDVLSAFFKQCNFYPKKVIFIDDLNENLDSVKTSLQPLNIEFKGYQYTGAKRFFKVVDEEVINYQFNHLMQTKEWLNDKQVEKLLEAKKKTK